MNKKCHVHEVYIQKDNPYMVDKPATCGKSMFFPIEVYKQMTTAISNE